MLLEEIDTYSFLNQTLGIQLQLLLVLPYGEKKKINQIIS